MVNKDKVSVSKYSKDYSVRDSTNVSRSKEYGNMIRDTRDTSSGIHNRNFNSYDTFRQNRGNRIRS